MKHPQSKGAVYMRSDVVLANTPIDYFTNT